MIVSCNLPRYTQRAAGFVRVPIKKIRLSQFATRCFSDQSSHSEPVNPLKSHKFTRDIHSSYVACQKSGTQGLALVSEKLNLTITNEDVVFSIIMDMLSRNGEQTYTKKDMKRAMLISESPFFAETFCSPKFLLSVAGQFFEGYENKSNILQCFKDLLYSQYYIDELNRIKDNLQIHQNNTDAKVMIKLEESIRVFLRIFSQADTNAAPGALL